jgi:hypothetical protein
MNLREDLDEPPFFICQTLWIPSKFRGWSTFMDGLLKMRVHVFHDNEEISKR